MRKPASPNQSIVSPSKRAKSVIEKRRRARINDCLEQLKTIVLQYSDEPTTSSKLEKADILEMTLKYVRALTKESETSKLTTTNNLQYQPKYRACAQVVKSFFNNKTCTEHAQLPLPVLREEVAAADELSGSQSEIRGDISNTYSGENTGTTERDSIQLRQEGKREIDKILPNPPRDKLPPVQVPANEMNQYYNSNCSYSSMDIKGGHVTDVSDPQDLGVSNARLGLGVIVPTQIVEAPSQHPVTALVHVPVYQLTLPLFPTSVNVCHQKTSRGGISLALQETADFNNAVPCGKSHCKTEHGQTESVYDNICSKVNHRSLPQQCSSDQVRPLDHSQDSVYTENNSRRFWQPWS